MMEFVLYKSPLEPVPIPNPFGAGRGGFERNEREAKKRGVLKRVKYSYFIRYMFQSAAFDTPRISDKLKFCPSREAVKKSKIK